MKSNKPSCSSKCPNCLYYKIGRCIAQFGDDFFIPSKDELIKEKDIRRFQHHDYNMYFVETNRPQ